MIIGEETGKNLEVKFMWVKEREGVSCEREKSGMLKKENKGCML